MWYTKLIYGVLLIIGLFFAILYDGIFSVVLFGILLLLPVSQLLLLFYLRKQLHLSLQVHEAVIGRQQQQILYCTLHNKSVLPMNYCAVTLNIENQTALESETIQLQLPLQGRFRAKVSFQLTSAHCGKLFVTVKNCRIMDYLHLFSGRVYSHANVSCMVIPSEQAEGLVMQNANRAQLEESVTYDPVKTGDDNTEIFGIREFQDNDNPKRIHWKRSSREEVLFVKEYSRPLERQYLIVVERLLPDRRRIDASRMDVQLELAHAFACILLRQQIPFSLAWNTDDGGLQCVPVTAPAQLQQCMMQILEDAPCQHGSPAAAQIHTTEQYAMLLHISHSMPDAAQLRSFSGQKYCFLTDSQAVQQETAAGQSIPITLETMQTVLNVVCNS